MLPIGLFLSRGIAPRMLAHRPMPRFSPRTIRIISHESFQHYNGPGGLKRRDMKGRIQVFHHQTFEWKDTEHPVHQRAIDYDSTPISYDEALAYMRYLREKQNKTN